MQKVKNEIIPHKNTKREIIYVFQGGGALGAYQVGAYEALSEHGYLPHMVVGISIGAINAAIIAGNKPEFRLQRLTQFWDKITTKIPFPMSTRLGLTKWHHYWSAQSSLYFGQPGFFTPKITNPWLAPDSTPNEFSFYDTAPLRDTLLDLIDFDYLNAGYVRICLGTVDLESGDFIFFDSHKETITVDHILASSALPPGFPPVYLNGRYYVDGGVFSNTPMSKVIDEFADNEDHIKNILCFMVDLFSAKGVLPHSMDGLMERIKDIQYSSHSKRSSALYATTQNLSHAIKFLSEKLTPKQRSDPQVKEILKLGYAHRLDIIRLVYHSERGTELNSKDYEFSTESANKHCRSGYTNIKLMIAEKEAEWSEKHKSGVTVYNVEEEKITSFKL